MPASRKWRLLRTILVGLAGLLLLVGFALGRQSDSVTKLAGDGASLPEPVLATQPIEQSKLEITKLEPGQEPPQFVVVSVDGGCETRSGVMASLMDLGDQTDSRFTIFLSGLCLLPESKRNQYRPPGYERGRSDIGFAEADMVGPRLDMLSRMYRSGHEIGTHFLGHFCGNLASGPRTGVGLWTKKQWLDEISQARKFVDQWPRFNPTTDVEPLPFDSSTFAGARTPCLLGDRPEMFAAFAEAGFRYDASDPGTLSWPHKTSTGGLWQFPLPALELSGTNLWVLAMDYNFLANQNNANTEADQATCDRIEEQTYQTYVTALAAAKEGNRAPLILGSHLNDWVCNTYVTSLHRFVRDTSENQPDVQFISFRDLADWLDAQDPGVLADLQARESVRDLKATRSE